MHQLTREQARRIAVRGQLLDTARPADLVSTVRGLTLLQVDPVSAVAPSADLVAWSRLGAAYDPEDLTTALQDRRLVELRAMVRPADDMVLYRAEMAAWPGGEDAPAYRHGRARWVADNDACRRDILARLESSGPLPSRELPDTCVRPWRSSGWTNDKNVTQLLEMMVLRGEVAVAGRLGRERLWDLASRVYPDEEPVPLEEALRQRNARRLRSLGIARERGPACPVEPMDVGTAGEPAEVEGVRGSWRVDPELLEHCDEPLRGRTALLSPFDRLVHDRKRTTELFGFDYQLEMYKPAAKRRWGYFALPVLHGDRLVGKLDARADRKAGVLQVDAVHEDEPFDATTRTAVDTEIEQLAAWLGLELSR